MEAFFLKLVNMSITASRLALAIISARLIFKEVPTWILWMALSGLNGGYEYEYI